MMVMVVVCVKCKKPPLPKTVVMLFVLFYSKKCVRWKMQQQADQHAEGNVPFSSSHPVISFPFAFSDYYYFHCCCYYCCCTTISAPILHCKYHRMWKRGETTKKKKKFSGKAKPFIFDGLLPSFIINH